MGLNTQSTKKCDESVVCSRESGLIGVEHWEPACKLGAMLIRTHHLSLVFVMLIIADVADILAAQWLEREIPHFLDAAGNQYGLEVAR